MEKFSVDYSSYNFLVRENWNVPHKHVESKSSPASIIRAIQPEKLIEECYSHQQVLSKTKTTLN